MRLLDATKSSQAIRRLTSLRRLRRVGIASLLVFVTSGSLFHLLTYTLYNVEAIEQWKEAVALPLSVAICVLMGLLIGGISVAIAVIDNGLIANAWRARWTRESEREDLLRQVGPEVSGNVLLRPDGTMAQEHDLVQPNRSSSDTVDGSAVQRLDIDELGVRRE